VYAITNLDGTTEHFRDDAVRYLVVKPDPETGELRPAVKRDSRCISTFAENSLSSENAFRGQTPRATYAQQSLQALRVPQLGRGIATQDVPHPLACGSEHACHRFAIVASTPCQPDRSYPKTLAPRFRKAVVYVTTARG